MDHDKPTAVPESLQYRDGRYALERFGASLTDWSPRALRIFTRGLRSIHRPWFAVRMPTGVAELTTTGRKSGQPRSTFVRAYRDGARAYLVAITGEHTLWLKNIRAHPTVTLRFGRKRFTGVARDPRDAAELAALRRAFTQTHPFDYPENMVHRSGFPTRAKIVELHLAWLEGGTPLVVDLDVPSPAAVDKGQ